MSAEILLTLKLKQKLFADPRRIELLKRIQQTGSISQGAKLAGISYKSAWDAINEMNQLSEHTLVNRSTGGKGGGGATLTQYGERLIQLFELLAQIQHKAFSVLQDDSLPLDSLLAAIARFSLQTSARNQFFGRVIRRDQQPILQQVDVLLSDGKSKIVAAITQQSAERLILAPQQEVLVLIKAPWVNLGARQVSVSEYDNQLPGTIVSILPGDENSEVSVQLESGDLLYATVPNQQLQALQAEVGLAVNALFQADQVIIATLC